MPADTNPHKIRAEFYAQEFGRAEDVRIDYRLYRVIGAMSVEIADLRRELYNVRRNKQ